MASWWHWRRAWHSITTLSVPANTKAGSRNKGKQDPETQTPGVRNRQQMALPNLSFPTPTISYIFCRSKDRQSCIDTLNGLKVEYKRAVCSKFQGLLLPPPRDWASPDHTRMQYQPFTVSVMVKHLSKHAPYQPGRLWHLNATSPPGTDDAHLL
jgi:hypothetical protein